MPRIIWEESFSVNHDEIDSQHRHWVEIHNRLHDTLLSGSAEAVKEAAVATLIAMRDYAKVHFAFEESYLDEINYPQRQAHAQIHKAFYRLVEEYIANIKDGRIVLNSEIVKVMKTWLENHILVEDKKYCRFVESGGQ